jgi:hypothetical protein
MAKRPTIGDLVADLLETEMKLPLVVIGWKLQPRHYQPRRVYKFRALTGIQPYEWTVLLTESTSPPKVKVDLDGKKTEYIVKDVDHFKSIVRKVNEQVYGASNFESAAMAMREVKSVFEASSLRELYLNQGVHYIEDGNALEIDVNRINDVSKIKIGLEKKKVVTKLGNDFVLPFFYVTFTTEMESESGKSVFLPPKEAHDLKDAVTALQTAVNMRIEWTLEPDMPRKERTDLSRDSRRYRPDDMSVSVFTADELMHKVHEGWSDAQSSFRYYFVQEGNRYTTRPMMQPYVFITVDPDVKAQNLKVAYQTGMGSDAWERKEEIWSHTGEVAKKALIMLNQLVRQYIDTPRMAKNCLESLLVYRRDHLKYDSKKKGFDVKITGDSSAIEIRFTTKKESPLLVFTRTYVDGHVSNIECYHHSRLMIAIDHIIQEVKRDRDGSHGNGAWP